MELERCPTCGREPGQTVGCTRCEAIRTQEPIRRPADAQATRFATNPDWTYRGDNTKYRSKK